MYIFNTHNIFIKCITYNLNRNSNKCGPISAYSLQKMEIFAETIRAANENQKLLPNVTMGFTILDYCNTYKVVQINIIVRKRL